MTPTAGEVWYEPLRDYIFVVHPFCPGMLWLNTEFHPNSSGGSLCYYHEFPEHAVYLGEL